MEEPLEEDHINEDFLSWMMQDMETKGGSLGILGGGLGGLVAMVGGGVGGGISLLGSNSNSNNLRTPLNIAITNNDIILENYESPDLSSHENNDNKVSEDNSTQLTGQKRKVSRSRELAKESRNRQRLRMQETEKRIAELRSENAELQAHLQNVTQRTTEVQRQRLDMERIMVEKIRDMNDLSSSNSRELEDILTKFVDLYADYGGYRQKEVLLY